MLIDLLKKTKNNFIRNVKILEYPITLWESLKNKFLQTHPTLVFLPSANVVYEWYLLVKYSDARRKGLNWPKLETFNDDPKNPPDPTAVVQR
jgi:peptidase E